MCGLLQRFYQLFGLSFWRHPFTAEDPLVSNKSCNAKFLYICFDEQINWSASWMAWGWVNFLANFHFWMNNSFSSQKCPFPWSVKSWEMSFLSSSAVVLKPVLGTPNHSIFCMSPSFNTPDLTHQLISRVCKTWSGCGLWERHTKCVVAGGPQDRFENHWSSVLSNGED